MKKTKKSSGMMFAILSLSLLTVMAGAAVAPALGTIRQHFSSSADTTVQLIISMPALFIFIASFIFPKLTKRYGSKTIVLMGLAMYVLGGCGAGLIDNIWIVLIFRAVVGLGVGLIMPMSTGLLSYYYPPEELDKLMGLSSAMNQLGGAVATFIAGILATLSWRAAFAVYLMGLISVALCGIFLPNEMIGRKDEPETPDTIGSKAANNDANSNAEHPENASPIKTYFLYVAAMFILMSAFFIYPSNFALVTAQDGTLSQQGIATVMALMDVVAFIGGLSFIGLKKNLGNNTHFVSPAFFFAGYALLFMSGSAVITVIGSFLIGFANGAGVPCIIAAASQKAGKDAVSTVMPLLSAALYMGQFLSPFIMSLVNALLGAAIGSHLPFAFAAVLAIILAVLGAGLRNKE